MHSEILMTWISLDKLNNSTSFFGAEGKIFFSKARKTASHLPISLKFFFFGGVEVVVRWGGCDIQHVSSFCNSPGLYSIQTLESGSILINMCEDLKLYQLVLVILNVSYIFICMS